MCVLYIYVVARVCGLALALMFVHVTYVMCEHICTIYMLVLRNKASDSTDIFSSR